MHFIFGCIARRIAACNSWRLVERTLKHSLPPSLPPSRHRSVCRVFAGAKEVHKFRHIKTVLMSLASVILTDSNTHCHILEFNALARELHAFFKCFLSLSTLSTLEKLRKMRLYCVNARDLQAVRETTLFCLPLCSCNFI